MALNVLPIRDRRTGEAGDDDGRRVVAQEDEDHRHDEDDREAELHLDVVDGRADRGGPVGEDRDRDVRRQGGLQGRQEVGDALDDLDDVRARLALDGDEIRGRCDWPALQLRVFRRVGHRGDVARGTGAPLRWR